MLIKSSSRGLHYKVHIPDVPFKNKFISIHEIKGVPNFTKERVWPSHDIELLINLGERIFGVFEGKEIICRHEEYAVMGNQFSFYDSIFPSTSYFFSVKFTNTCFYETFGIPPGELVNDCSVLFEKKRILKFVKSILSCSNFEDRIKKVYQELSQSSFSSKSNLIHNIEQLVTANPAVNSKTMESTLGYTPKYLNRLFKNTTGYTISNFKRIKRFEKTINDLKNDTNSNWQDLIHKYNYYDQSHFIKEFKHFAGMTPEILVKKLDRNHRNIILG